MDGIEYLPEPTDPRILSAVDPSIAGWQDGFRAKVTGWEPLVPPLTEPPRRVKDRTIGIWVVVILLTALLVLWDYQQPLTKLSYSDSEWAWEDSGIRSVQELDLSGEGVHVCIVDTGIDLTHPDLNSVEVNFKDFVGNSAEAFDYGTISHGTMMAGILVGEGHISGAAPNVTLSVAAALQPNQEDENSGDEGVVADAIDWCWEQQSADIISLSLGGDAMEGGQSTYSAVERAIAAGTFVVAAAGNDGGNEDDGFVASPANVPLAIAVGSTSENGTMWESSSRGNQQMQSGVRSSPNEKPEVVAPGVEIISTGPEGGYFSSSGTSDSTVFVVGALALIIEANPEIGRSESSGSSCIELVKMSLANSSKPLDGQNLPHDDQAGYGFLDAAGWLDDVSKSLPC